MDLMVAEFNFDLKGQYIGEFKEIGSLVDWSMGK